MIRRLVRPSILGRLLCRISAPIVALGILLFAAPFAEASSRHCKAGASGAGDPYFPESGNGGYDVGHYDLDLAYDPATDNLRGRAKVEAKATESLCSFNLDLLGFEVKRIKVRNEKASWSRDGQELTVTPKKPLHKGKGFAVSIRYSGVRSTSGNRPTASRPPSPRPATEQTQLDSRIRLRPGSR